MKRRGFLQALVGAIVAVFAPAMATSSQQSASPKGFRPVAVPVRYEHQTVTSGAVFSGDICVWDGAKYRRVDEADFKPGAPLLGDRLAVAVPDGSGGFHYMREGIFAVPYQS